jgi:hypothetical protein
VYFYQYILLAGFVCLLFNSRTRFASVVFLLGWAVYTISTLSVSTAFYYISAGTIEAAIAYTLNKRYRVIAYLGYSLIFVNFYGLMLYKNGISPVSYDTIYAVISVTQLLFLLMRAIPNGLNRLSPKHFVVRAVNFDSRGAYARMYKSIQAKGENQ